MARRPRLFIADIPYHIVQRGNNRGPIFFSEKDYLFFLKILREAKIEYPCLIYSYCLMTNHFHLLVQPKQKENVSLLMKLLGAKYVRYINKVYKRTGTLWEGRFKCSLIEGESYFLTCLHYIEMNSVRAGIVDLVDLYRWSSYRVRAFGEKNLIIDLDPWYSSLGHNSIEQQMAYRRFFKQLTPNSGWALIREMTNKGGLVGRDSFREYIEKLSGREIIFRPPGRPKNKSDPI